MPATSPPPLVIDLDGTLLRSDMLVESALGHLRQAPHRVLRPLGWLRRGKAALKAGLAESGPVDVGLLPYDPEVLALIRAARAEGRPVVLATATHRSLAERVATHLGLFDRVLATEHALNLSAGNKRDALVHHYGEGGFDYAGNAEEDLPVWRAAREAILVNPGAALEARSRREANVTAVIRSGGGRLADWAKALRLHQWLKNLLVFVPLLAAHRLDEPAVLLAALLAFLAFGLCASSVYVLNDLLDLEDDRKHARKRTRPFAAGRLAPQQGLAASAISLALALLLCLLALPAAFLGTLALYYGLTLAYSLFLKRRAMVDVLTLAALYTLRILAGAAACGIVVTSWMLAFSVFMFLSLALVKRYAELRHAREAGQVSRTPGRGYYPGDLDMIASLGGSAGYLAVLVLALYIDELGGSSLYRHPELIWLACPLLLYWISRTWMMTHRGEMHDDPVVFAARDGVSLVVGLLFGLVFWAAT